MILDPAMLLQHQFQSTPPRGGRQPSLYQPDPFRMFQSTPPRGGRPWLFAALMLRNGVSIHAPARGATEPKDAKFQLLSVSIHAPARGAT